MPITVCTDTDFTRKSLLEIYAELVLCRTSEHNQKVSKAMIELINLINQLFKDTQIWGLTSHYRLILLTENRWNSKGHVIIYYGSEGYYFEYAMPDEKCPWPNAYVRGHSKSLEEAKKYLAISMNESGAWKGNVELNNLLADYAT